MHITIQIPIADLRQTVDNPPPRVVAPNWARLEPYTTFTRCFGAIEPRQLGVGAVSGDELFLSARRAIRLADGFGSKPIQVGDIPILFECTFRRFFFDGEATGRFEVGFAVRRASQRHIVDEGVQIDVSRAVQALLSVPCTISGTKDPVPLGKLGPYLANLWVQSTSPHPKDPNVATHYWMGKQLCNGPVPAYKLDETWAVPGKPLAIVESKPDIPLKVAGNIVKVDEEYGKIPHSIFFLQPTPKLTIPVWLFNWNTPDAVVGGERSKPIRHLRMLLLRTHADKEVMWAIAKYIAERGTALSKKELDNFVQFLNTRSGLLAPRTSVYAKERYGILDWKLCMMAHEVEKYSAPTFEQDLERLKKFFSEEVVEMLRTNEGFRKLETKLGFEAVENPDAGLQGGIRIYGDVANSNVLLAKEVKDSFNAPKVSGAAGG